MLQAPWLFRRNGVSCDLEVLRAPEAHLPRVSPLSSCQSGQQPRTGLIQPRAPTLAEASGQETVASGPLVSIGWSPQETPAATSPSVQLPRPPHGLPDGRNKPAVGTRSGEPSPDQTPLGASVRGLSPLAVRQGLDVCSCALIVLFFPPAPPPPHWPSSARPVLPAGWKERRGNQTPQWLGWLQGPCPPGCWGRTEDGIRG